MHIFQGVAAARRLDGRRCANELYGGARGGHATGAAQLLLPPPAPAPAQTHSGRVAAGPRRAAQLRAAAW
eukprot:853571-Prymnesium_polylepis.1